MFNVVLVTIDSLRSDVVSCRNANEKIPFLNELSKRSCVFENAIAPGIPTFFCFPSLMTGNLPFDLGEYLGIPRSFGVETVAERLKSEGYKTFAIVSDNPALYPSYDYNRGFDVYSCFQKASSRKISTPLRQLARSLSSISFLRKSPKSIGCMYRTLLTPQIPMNGEEVNSQARNLLRRTCQPFFLWLHYMDTHFPYYSGLKYRKSSSSLARDLLDKLRFHHFTFNIDLGGKGRSSEIDDLALLATIKEVYTNSIRYVDSIVADIYDYVIDRFPETILVVTSDHGEAFMEHGVFFHEPYILYDELIKVPLIVKLPDGKGKSVEKTVSLASLPKTIMEIVGVESDFGGTNIIEFCENADEHYLNHVTETLWGCRAPHLRLGIFDNRTEIRGYHKMFSYRTELFKYILNTQNGKEEVYDLKNDPKEKANMMHLADRCDFHDFVVRARHNIKMILGRRMRRIPKMKERGRVPSAQEKEDIIKRLQRLGYL